MMTSTRISRAGWAVAMLLTVGLAGCGSSSDSASKAEAKNKKVHTHTTENPANRPTADMVAGVSAAKAGPPVELKFELRELPLAGQPLDVDVAVIPDVATINRVYARFQSGQGLDVIEGDQLATVEKPAVGTPIRHVLRLFPKEDGIYTVSATVSVDLQNDAITRSFSIPIIVGDGLPDPAPRADVAEGVAHPVGPARAGPPAPGAALKTH